ncbi:hypothetical protein JST97_22835 [bacterium]|nr:hypothetical protein [bacterium]
MQTLAPEALIGLPTAQPETRLSQAQQPKTRPQQLPELPTPLQVQDQSPVPLLLQATQDSQTETAVRPPLAFSGKPGPVGIPPAFVVMEAFGALTQEAPNRATSANDQQLLVSGAGPKPSPLFEQPTPTDNSGHAQDETEREVPDPAPRPRLMVDFAPPVPDIKTAKSPATTFIPDQALEIKHPAAPAPTQPGRTVVPLRNQPGAEVPRSTGLLERLQQPIPRSPVELPKVVVGNFQKAAIPEPEPQVTAESSPALPDHLVSLAVNLLKQQPRPNSQPLRQEILQRLQSPELLPNQPAGVPATSVVLAQVEKIQVETLEETKPKQTEGPRTESEEVRPPLSLDAPTRPASVLSTPKETNGSTAQVPDATENIQRLARQQGRALIEKPRELDVHLRSERLGDVSAHLKINAGGHWTAHLQLRDAQVEQSVRQELNQISENRGLEGFTTSLSQDNQGGQGSFQGFSFQQEQQPRSHFGQGDLERRQRTYQGNSSSQASTFDESLPIEGVSSVHGTHASGGLNVRA